MICWHRPGRATRSGTVTCRKLRSGNRAVRLRRVVVEKRERQVRRVFRLGMVRHRARMAREAGRRAGELCLGFWVNLG
jgi:hypothetical protein